MCCLHCDWPVPASRVRFELALESLGVGAPFKAEHVLFGCIPLLAPRTYLVVNDEQ